MLQCDLSKDGGWNLFDFDTLLNLTYDGQNGGKSPPFPGISFQQLPPPTITGIEGCAAVSADGQITSGCVPDSTVLTLHGANFSTLDTTDFYIYIGANRQYATLNVEWGWAGTAALPGSAPNYTDSRLTFSIADTYDDLVEEKQYNGAPIPVYLASVTGSNGYYIKQSWRSNSVYVQFAPLPPPTVSSISNLCCNQRCSEDAVTGEFTNCTPGRTRIELSGKYLYPGLNITVGGVQAVEDVRARVSSAGFILPLGAFDPTKRYDLTVTTFAGNFTWPAAFSFTASPIIAWVDPCVDTGYTGFNGPSIMKCFPGQTITMHVANFNFSALTYIEFADYRQQSAICLNPQPDPADPLLGTCVIPDYWPGWRLDREEASMTAFFDTTPATQSNRLNHLWLWDFPISPRVTSITGCSSTLPATSLQLTECMGGEVLTITGRGFNDSSLSAAFSPKSGLRGKCEPMTIINDTVCECELPIMDATVQFGVSYQMTLEVVFWDHNNNANPTKSNGIYITYVDELPIDPLGPSTSSSSSSSSLPFAPSSSPPASSASVLSPPSSSAAVTSSFSTSFSSYSSSSSSSLSSSSRLLARSSSAASPSGQLPSTTSTLASSSLPSTSAAVSSTSESSSASTPLTPVLSTTSASSSPAASLASSAIAPPGRSSSSSMSAGAIAGVSIGSVIGVLLLTGLLVALCWCVSRSSGLAGRWRSMDGEGGRVADVGWWKSRKASQRVDAANHAELQLETMDV